MKEKKPKILIIDDEEVILTVLQELFTREGYEVAIARSGEKGIEIFQQDEFNLAIIDKNLEGRSGIDILKTVKEINPNVEAMIITGYASLESAIESIRLGAYDYILKPIESLSGIAERVKRALEKQRMAEGKIRLLEKLRHSHEELERAYLETLKVVANTIEAKDPYTRGHIDRVMSLSVKVGEELGLRSEELRDIQFASVLHDIGKITIRADVLTKPGRLSNKEYEHIQGHSLSGAKIIEGVDFLKDALPLVKHHQERYDGTGYPDGLKGENIPLGARIITTVDSYDAMLSDRPYRKEMSVEEAIEELTRNVGKHFDGRVVDALIRKIKYG